MIPNRIVLDTNVCLDLFVFRDPRRAGLAAALQDGSVEAVTRADCRNEWLAVLHYPCFALDAARREACAAQFDAVIRCVGADVDVDATDASGPSVGGERAGSARPPGAPLLPRCTDPDDQKFLEIACDSGAATLLTKDRALLKLAGKCRRAGLFAIVEPQAWHAPLATASLAAPTPSKGAAAGIGPYPNVAAPRP